MSTNHLLIEVAKTTLNSSEESMSSCNDSDAPMLLAVQAVAYSLIAIFELLKTFEHPMGEDTSYLRVEKRP